MQIENFKPVAEIRKHYGNKDTSDETLVKGYANKLVKASKQVAESHNQERSEYFMPLIKGTQYILNGTQWEQEETGVVRADSKDGLPTAVGLRRGRVAADPAEVLAAF